MFRGDHYLTIHRLVWKDRESEGGRLVFRGDYNRLRERVAPGAVIARVVAVEIPGRRRGAARVVSIEPDVLARFYGLAFGIHRLLRPLLPGGGATGRPAGRFGRAARSIFSGVERLLSIFLPERR